MQTAQTHSVSKDWRSSPTCPWQISSACPAVKLSQNGDSQQNTSAQQLQRPVLKREWMMQCGSIFSLFSHFLLFILSVRSSHMIGSLATSLLIILRRLRQSSGSLNAGELVSHPQRGVLQLFTHKDAWRVLINKHIRCHRHLGIDYSIVVHLALAFQNEISLLS